MALREILLGAVLLGTAALPSSGEAPKKEAAPAGKSFTGATANQAPGARLCQHPLQPTHPDQHKECRPAAHRLELQ